MKNLLVTLLLSSAVLLSNAQVKNVTYSPGFEEPGQIDLRLLQLPNGNTFFFNFSDKEIQYTLYNKERRSLGKKEIDNDIINKKTIKSMVIEGLYEIGGEAVLFAHIMEKRVPQLYRIRFDKDNGRILEQKKIGELMKYKLTSGYAMAFGGVELADFRIMKDPNSDAYAQVNFNSFAKETNRRIEVIHYQVIDGKQRMVFGPSMAAVHVGGPGGQDSDNSMMIDVCLGSAIFGSSTKLSTNCTAAKIAKLC